MVVVRWLGVLLGVVLVCGVSGWVDRDVELCVGVVVPFVGVMSSLERISMSILEALDRNGVCGRAVLAAEDRMVGDKENRWDYVEHGFLRWNRGKFRAVRVPFTKGAVVLAKALHQHGLVGLLSPETDGRSVRRSEMTVNHTVSALVPHFPTLVLSGADLLAGYWGEWDTGWEEREGCVLGSVGFPDLVDVVPPAAVLEVVDALGEVGCVFEGVLVRKVSEETAWKKFVAPPPSNECMMSSSLPHVYNRALQWDAVLPWHRDVTLHDASILQALSTSTPVAIPSSSFESIKAQLPPHLHPLLLPFSDVSSLRDAILASKPLRAERVRAEVERKRRREDKWWKKEWPGIVKSWKRGGGRWNRRGARLPDVPLPSPSPPPLQPLSSAQALPKLLQWVEQRRRREVGGGGGEVGGVGGGEGGGWREGVLWAFRKPKAKALFRLPVHVKAQAKWQDALEEHAILYTNHPNPPPLPKFQPITQLPTYPPAPFSKREAYILVGMDGSRTVVTPGDGEEGISVLRGAVGLQEVWMGDGWGMVWVGGKRREVRAPVGWEQLLWDTVDEWKPIVGNGLMAWTDKHSLMAVAGTKSALAKLSPTLTSTSLSSSHNSKTKQKQDQGQNQNQGQEQEVVVGGAEGGEEGEWEEGEWEEGEWEEGSNIVSSRDSRHPPMHSPSPPSSSSHEPSPTPFPKKAGLYRVEGGEVGGGEVGGGEVEVEEEVVVSGVDLLELMVVQLPWGGVREEEVLGSVCLGEEYGRVWRRFQATKAWYCREKGVVCVFANDLSGVPAKLQSRFPAWGKVALARMILGREKSRSGEGGGGGGEGGENDGENGGGENVGVVDGEVIWMLDCDAAVIRSDMDPRGFSQLRAESALVFQREKHGYLAGGALGIANTGSYTINTSHPAAAEALEVWWERYTGEESQWEQSALHILLPFSPASYFATVAFEEAPVPRLNDMIGMVVTVDSSSGVLHMCGPVGKRDAAMRERTIDTWTDLLPFARSSWRFLVKTDDFGELTLLPDLTAPHSFFAAGDWGVTHAHLHFPASPLSPTRPTPPQHLPQPPSPPRSPFSHDTQPLHAATLDFQLYSSPLLWTRMHPNHHHLHLDTLYSQHAPMRLENTGQGPTSAQAKQAMQKALSWMRAAVIVLQTKKKAKM